MSSLEDSINTLARGSSDDARRIRSLISRAYENGYDDGYEDSRVHREQELLDTASYGRV